MKKFLVKLYFSCFSLPPKLSSFTSLQGIYSVVSGFSLMAQQKENCGGGMKESGT